MEKISKDKYIDLFFWSEHDKEYLHNASWDLKTPNMVHTSLLSTLNYNNRVFNEQTIKIIYRNVKEYNTPKRWKI